MLNVWLGHCIWICIGAIHLPLLPVLLYVQSMSPRWLSLSSCFYLNDNSARVNITQLYKYYGSPYTKTLLNECERLDGARWKYRIHRFSDLSSASTRFNLRSQISCRNTGWRNATVAICPFSVFDSLLLSSFGPKLLLGKYVAMLSRRARPAKIRHSLTTTLAVLLSNKVTPRCNPEFVGLLSGKFTSIAFFKKVSHLACCS